MASGLIGPDVAGAGQGLVEPAFMLERTGFVRVAAPRQRIHSDSCAVHSVTEMSNSAGRTNAVLKASGSCSAGGLCSMTCTLRRLPEFCFFASTKHRCARVRRSDCQFRRGKTDRKTSHFIELCSARSRTILANSTGICVDVISPTISAQLPLAGT